MSEINPNHPVTQSMHDQWHKIALILMEKFAAKEVEINSTDIAAVAGRAIVVAARGELLLLLNVDRETGRRLAAEAGGLPT